MRWRKKINRIEGDGYWLLKESRVRLSDGPHGVRKETSRGTLQATCFPTASALACSWDEKLAELVGESLATECIASDIDVLLGPGVNLQRHPSCGRNFEYFGEDPFLSGKMAAAYIRGVQSKNVAATLKHFALNSQETDRFLSDSIVDERTLRELYLMPFEIAIRESDPWAVMTAYNRFEGMNAGESKRLLSILRDEWHYDGCVMSDWGSVENRLLGLEAGMDLEMPGGSSPSRSELKKAYRKGKLNEEFLDRSLANIQRLETRARSVKRSSHLGHYDVAVQVARECMVLLKNDDDLLPLNPTKEVYLAGAIDETQIQGLGSSRVEPLITSTPIRQWQESQYAFKVLNHRDLLKIKQVADDRDLVNIENVANHCSSFNNEKIINHHFSSAIDMESEKPLICNASDGAESVATPICLFFAKLPPDAEGYERPSLELAEEDIVALDALKNAGMKVILILQAGAPLVLGDIAADAILQMNYAGEGAYEALQSILYGDYSPCGRLCASWPLSKSDIPSNAYYPDDRFQAQYREGIFVGYRYYTTFDKPVAYPFGYGLTYGQFEYEHMEAEFIGDHIYLTVRLSNVGKHAAKEVVQIYVSHPESSLLRPFYELKAWEKVELQPTEKREVVLKLPRQCLMTYTSQGEKVFENGEYYFLCGPNCRDLKLVVALDLHEESKKAGSIVEAVDLSIEELRQYHLQFTGLKESSNIPAIYRTMNRPVTEKEFEQLLGRKLPEIEMPRGVDAPLSAFRGPLRILLFKMAFKQADSMLGDRELNRKMVLSMPIRALVRLSGKPFLSRILKLLVFLGGAR